MYSKIVNPKTGRKVNVNSVFGKKILRKYLSVLKGGASSQWASGGASAEERPLRCPDAFPISCGRHNVFADPDDAVMLCGSDVFECITQSNPGALTSGECSTDYGPPNEKCEERPSPFGELITMALDSSKWTGRSILSPEMIISMFSSDACHRSISLILYYPGALAAFNTELKKLCDDNYSSEHPFLILRRPGVSQAGFFIDMEGVEDHFHFYGRQTDLPYGGADQARYGGGWGGGGGLRPDVVEGTAVVGVNGVREKDMRTRWGHFKRPGRKDLDLTEGMLEDPLESSNWITLEVMNLLVYILRCFRKRLKVLSMDWHGRDHRRPGKSILRPVRPAPAADAGGGFVFGGRRVAVPGRAAGALLVPSGLDRFRYWEAPLRADTVRWARGPDDEGAIGLPPGWSPSLARAAAEAEAEAPAAPPRGRTLDELFAEARDGRRGGGGGSGGGGGGGGGRDSRGGRSGKRGGNSSNEGGGSGGGGRGGRGSHSGSRSGRRGGGGGGGGGAGGCDYFNTGRTCREARRCPICHP